MISVDAQISHTAIIHNNVTIEEGVIIHDYVVIYPNVVIRKGCEIFDHCVLGKIPISPGTTSRKLKEYYSELVIDENTVICPSSVVYAGVRIGKKVLLGDFCSIREECNIGDECIISRNVSVNYNTSIGRNVKIMDNTHITGNMIIEDNVFISVLVSTTNDNSMGRTEYSSESVVGPIIRKGATIGAGSNILPGIEIGQDAIVGAGSIVTKNIPPRKLYMGSPARYVRDVRYEEQKYPDTEVEL